MSFPSISDRRTGGPAAVETAFRLWLLAAAIGVLSAILSLAGSLNSVVSTVISVVLVVIWVLVVFTMRRGSNVARTVLAVLGVLNVLFTVLGLTGMAVLFGYGLIGVLDVVLNLLEAIVIVAAIVFMYRPEATAYFRGA